MKCLISMNSIYVTSCSTAAESVVKKGFPVPDLKMTTRPFSK